MVENLVAAAVITIATAAIYPLFTHTNQTHKIGETKALCENIVRGKLGEYRQGIPVKLSDFTGAWPGLDLLSYTSHGGSTSTQVVNGFFFAKLRYNMLSNQTAPVNTTAVCTAPRGVLECIGDTTNPATPASCTSEVDKRAQLQLPGFQLYIKLELSSPWVYTPSSPAALIATTHHNLCPKQDGLSTTNDLFDFMGAADGIRITVTGVMDSAQVQGMTGVSDTSRLECSMSTTVQPARLPARFFVTSDGKISTIQGRGRNGDDTASDASRWTLENLWETGIRSLAVHPRNFSVWVLRNGSLSRYSDCGRLPFNCTTDSTLAGISDFGETAPAVQEWNVDPGISSIGVDFRSGVVYGLAGSRGQVYRIEGSGGRNLGLVTTACTPATCPTTLIDILPGKFPFQYGSFPARATGFFINPEGDEASVSDITQSDILGGGSSYGASIYRASDLNLTSPLLTVPVQAISFSH